MAVDGEQAYFTTNQVREDTEAALFGELSYDLTDTLTATVGARVFDTDSSIEGFVGTVFSGSPDVDVEQSESGSLYKVNLTWQPSSDRLFYATVSEGFRPGGVNRASTSNIPGTYDSDLITNYEFGWKKVGVEVIVGVAESNEFGGAALAYMAVDPVLDGVTGGDHGRSPRRV